VSKFSWYSSACAFAVLWTSAAIAQAPHFTTLTSFANTNGAYPWATLLLASDGNFYGTTQNGGKNTDCGYGYSCGTVFRITPGGKLTVIHNFTNDGGNSSLAGLVQGANGDLYGVTLSGGKTIPQLPYGMGVVFELSLSGKYTVLHKFAYTDGASPQAGLMLGHDGNFYGTTGQGGQGGGGTIFRMTPAGALTTLWNFDYGQYGVAPLSAMVETTAGDFYGTAEGGVTGGGVVFEWSAKGRYSVLHYFSGNADGGAPTAGLLIGKDGNLYGATENGGAYVAYGTIYRLTLSGKLKTLHNFDVTDGDVPFGTLIQGTDGNFYGTTAYGGNTPYYGTIFKMTPNGKITTLHQFDITDGAFVYAGLVQAPNGTLYGDTFQGGSSAACGTYGCGTVYSLTLGKK
jgi:uncharacterized repeat protein (TIGR03803 family)